MKSQDRLIVAIDAAGVADVLRAVSGLRDAAGAIKIGSTAFNANGPLIVQAIKKMEKRVFLDLKLFDIPEQVSGAVRAMTALGVFMMTVHTLGGIEMMAAAKRASLEEAMRLDIPAPLIIGVTILTSLDDIWLARVGLPGTGTTVPVLAGAAQDASLDGVVCSAFECASIKAVCGTDFLTVVPGIRRPDSAKDDQKRVATPHFARTQGADYLVVGRPITAAADPNRAAKEIIKDMG